MRNWNRTLLLIIYQKDAWNQRRDLPAKKFWPTRFQCTGPCSFVTGINLHLVRKNKTQGRRSASKWCQHQSGQVETHHCKCAPCPSGARKRRWRGRTAAPYPPCQQTLYPPPCQRAENLPSNSTHSPPAPSFLPLLFLLLLRGACFCIRHRPRAPTFATTHLAVSQLPAPCHYPPCGFLAFRVFLKGVELRFFILATAVCGGLWAGLWVSGFWVGDWKDFPILGKIGSPWLHCPPFVCQLWGHSFMGARWTRPPRLRVFRRACNLRRAVRRRL